MVFVVSVTENWGLKADQLAPAAILTDCIPFYCDSVSLFVAPSRHAGLSGSGMITRTLWPYNTLNQLSVL